MASIINAATSGGLITTADTSGILNLQTAGTTAITVDASQNVGVGVTPSAWGTTYKAQQIGQAGVLAGHTAVPAFTLASNAYENSGWKAITTNPAHRIDLSSDNNATIFYRAASVTAGNALSWAESMRLDSSGNVGIGTSSPSGRLHVNSTGAAIAYIQSTLAAGNTNVETRYISTNRIWGVGQNIIQTSSIFEVADVTAGATRLAIDSSGNLGIGTTSPARRLESRSTGGLQLRAAYDTANYIDIGHMSGATGGVINSVGDATVNRFLSIQLDGVQQMRILSTGYVGINTSTPGTNGAFEIRRGVTTGAMTNCSFSTSDAANSTFDVGHPSANVVALSAQGSHLAFYGGGALGNAERMRIDQTYGSLLVGTTSPAARLTVVNDNQTLDWALSLKTVPDSAGSNNYFLIDFRTSANYQTGYIWSNGGTTTSLATVSDYRLKNSITPMTGALAKVAQLKPVTYKWNVNNSDGQGFIAHELQEVVPDCVSGEKDGLDKEGNPRYQGVDTSFLVATLTAAIQEQQALITQLTTRITALESA